MESAIFINNSGLDYLQAEVAVATRKWSMKLYKYTANGIQRSRCSEIGLPRGEKLSRIRFFGFFKFGSFYWKMESTVFI